jgi:hypothetical protein
VYATTFEDPKAANKAETAALAEFIIMIVFALIATGMAIG